ncbi:hypothetical protein HYDPIDRAFT_116985 [Hydnomerulius pinastri MD-312]|uniref:Uncharacterized protein n=1 Tax=Hydnomerulius pinastri MD-312 TaxID=994086 RepID=A0A0C9W7M8_9AGAM|nr:hypothetical protein HYDPIDRAFT_119474 [Hydnomerulius pinastri MD-312]KIJ60497.1 hypothetical protein HYDPIDRAFT_116985 [Hydnomerulius pinastri MD-312]
MRRVPKFKSAQSPDQHLQVHPGCPQQARGTKYGAECNAGDIKDVAALVVIARKRRRRRIIRLQTDQRPLTTKSYYVE